jgi:RNA polymerase sigma factor (sigma-70 family)
MEDAELVASALQESTEAFANIYDRYVDRIYDYARSILRSDADAADVTQDTFLAASQRLDQLRDPSRLRPWLYAIARSHSLRIVRDRQRTQVSDDVDEVVGMTAPDGEIDARDLVWAAAAGLAASDRSVLDLHLRQGLDGQELADALGVSANVANVALHRVRTRLEQSVGAVLLAKTSKKECPELDELMVDGLNPLARKRITRHLDKCAVCEDRRRAMTSPSMLFSAMPLAVAPLVLRDQLLESIGSARAAEASDALEWRADGFPAPEPIAKTAGFRAASNATARGRVVALASTAAVALFALTGLFLLMRSDGPNSIESADAPLVTVSARSTQSADDLDDPSTSTDPVSTNASLGAARSEGSSSTLESLPSTTVSPTTSISSSQAGAPSAAPAAAPPPAATPAPPFKSTEGEPAPPDTVASEPVVTDPVASVPVETVPATTTTTITTTTTTTIPETVPPLPPSISLVSFVCASTMQVTVDIDPSISVSGSFKTSAGQSSPLVAHGGIAGRFLGELVIGEGSVTPRVVATGPGGTTTLNLASCIVID